MRIFLFATCESYYKRRDTKFCVSTMPIKRCCNTIFKSFLPLALVFIFNVPAHSQTLSVKDKAIINTEAIYLLKRYEQVLGEMAKKSGKNEAELNKLKDEFLDLFLNRKIAVFNDLEPTHSLSEFYEVETYISNLALWYPDGMNINIDFENAQSPGIQFHKDNIWFVDISVAKNINGNYMNRSVNSYREELSFRIAFVKEKNKFLNFKLVGIRSAASQTADTGNKTLSELNKAEYTDDEWIRVKQSVTSLLMDYERALQFIGEPDMPAEDKELIKADLIQLFENEQVKTINDIMPKPEDEQVEIENYIGRYIKSYPKGIINLSVNVDSAEFRHIEKDEGGLFKMDIYANKFFSGLYEGKNKHSFADKLVFSVSFNKNEGVFSNFKIKSIDKQYVSYSGINIAGSKENALTSIEPITRKGHSFGITATYGISSIIDKNIAEQTIPNDYNEWTTTNKTGYSFGLEYNKFFNENIGLSSGIKYVSFQASYSISGAFVSENDFTDANNKPYESNVEVDYDSLININYIAIPLGIDYIKDLNRKTGVYLSAGLLFSFKISSEYESIGEYENFGYYSSNPDGLKEISEPLLGHLVKDLPASGKVNAQNINLLGYASVGVTIKTGYYNYIKMGPTIFYGLANIKKDGNVYFNIFGKAYEGLPSKTNLMGFKIAFIHML